MYYLAQLFLIAWIPFVLVLFASGTIRRAIIIAYVGAWLFLPTTGISFPGLPDLTKTSSANVSVLLGILLFDAGRIFRLRWSWMDVPAILLALSPIATSLSNDLGLYDGLSEALKNVLAWSVPYFVGRLYFTEAAAMRDLAIGIFIGGLLYIPLCLFEMKFSPVLNMWLYGFQTFFFPQAARMGGWRPVVFMQHGLMVAMWMNFATFCGWWLWRTRSLKHVGGLSMGMLVIPLALTTLFCRSLFAMLMLILGLTMLHACHRLRISWPLLLVLVIPPMYVTLRTTQLMPREPVIGLVSSITGPDRAHSLDSRMRQEDLYGEITMKRPLLGWGGFGRGVPIDPETGKEVLRGIDGLWTIVSNKNGMIGLAGVMLLFWLPTVRLVWIFPMRYWKHPEYAGMVVALIILMVFQLDILLNAMLNPIYVVLAGGLVSCCRVYTPVFTRLRQSAHPAAPERYRAAHRA